LFRTCLMLRTAGGMSGLMRFAIAYCVVVLLVLCLLAGMTIVLSQYIALQNTMSYKVRACVCVYAMANRVSIFVISIHMNMCVCVRVGV